jgi:arginine/ornithine N-succinyltransferase beta subunit
MNPTISVIAFHLFNSFFNAFAKAVVAELHGVNVKVTPIPIWEVREQSISPIS